MLFIKQAVLCLISLLHLSRRFAKWWIPKSHILKRVGEIYKRTSMKDLLKFRIKAFALIAILLLSVVGGLSAKKIAIIDAGSSGSRLYVYDVNEVAPAPGVTIDILYPNAEEKELSKGPALSGVKDCQECVDCFLTTMTSKYEVQKGEVIDLYVLATAGMRLVDGTTANGIYTKMRHTSPVGYKLEKAMTISGRYEGLYAWIAANYKARTLTWSSNSWHVNQTSCGILEIGGASMQIAFFPSSASSEGWTVSEGLNQIYSESYLKGGVDQVFNYRKVTNAEDFGVTIARVELPSESPTILGLGKPIKNAIAEWRQKKISSSSFEDYAASLEITKDTYENYHPATNARYIAHVIDKLGLDIDKIDVSTESDWTEGAALDIVVNNNDLQPEPFNYPPADPN